MNTQEILAAFLKGNEVANISEKQRVWLLSQAKKEGVKTNNDGFRDLIYLSDCHFVIKSASVRVGGYGGTVGHKFTGRYNLEKLYTIRFTSTGLTAVCHKSDLDHYRREGHMFELINQL